MSTISTYLLYYIVVFSTSIIVYFSDLVKTSRVVNIRSTSKFIFWSALFIPVVIAGYRYDVGADFFSYERIYYRLTHSGMSLIENIQYTRYEPGWIALNHFVKAVFDNSTYVFVISALLTWGVFLKSIYNYRDKISIGIAVLVLFTSFYNISFNTIRQTIAIAFVMLSIRPMLEGRFWKFAFPVLLAGCFHYTALIFLPSYWAVNSRTRMFGALKKYLVPILFVCLVVFINPMLSLIANIEVFATYERYDLEYSGFNIKNVILRIPIFILFVLTYKKMRVMGNPAHRLIVLYIIGFILLNLGDFSVHVGRISRYFEALQIFIVGAMVHVQTDKKEKLLYVYLIVLYFLLRFSVIYLWDGQQQTIPYQWIFSK